MHNLITWIKEKVLVAIVGPMIGDAKIQNSIAQPIADFLIKKFDDQTEDDIAAFLRLIADKVAHG